MYKLYKNKKKYKFKESFDLRLSLINIVNNLMIY